VPSTKRNKWVSNLDSDCDLTTTMITAFLNTTSLARIFRNKEQDGLRLIGI